MRSFIPTLNARREIRDQKRSGKFVAFADLRNFIDGAARIGELKVIDGAHWNLEIGCLTELMAEQEVPLLLFDKIVDYPSGFRIATNALATPRRFALALGRSLALALLCRHAQWALEHGERRPLAAALRFSGEGLPRAGLDDLDLVASLAMDRPER